MSREVEREELSEVENEKGKKRRGKGGRKEKGERAKKNKARLGICNLFIAPLSLSIAAH